MMDKFLKVLDEMNDALETEVTMPLWVYALMVFNMLSLSFTLLCTAFTGA